MRTKTLLLAAVLGAAGVATSMAQVYSVNTVGYVNVSVPTGFSMISNPLSNSVAGGNSVSNLFPSVPDGTTLYVFNNGTGQYAPNAYDGLAGAWGSPTAVLLPGDGVFILAPSPFTNTFVGDVLQGSLSTPVPSGFSIKSSQVPQSLPLYSATDTNNLNFPVLDGTIIYRYNNASGNYSVTAWDGLSLAWSGAIPVPNVGESFFVQAPGAASWTRNFTP